MPMQQLTEAQPLAPLDTAHALTFTVIVPTFRRAAQLLECLRALAVQELPPSQVIVVVRDIDAQTKATLDDHVGPAPEVVFVARGGQTHALNSALKHATGELVAFTDDDAIPKPDWLRQLAAEFADPTVGGVGGKVIVPRQTAKDSSRRHLVGSVSPLGRPRGNHHLGDGRARDVMWLKGVNMSYRRELCWFDESLRGAGAQVANDSEIALRIHDAGWRIIYSPTAAVDHRAGPRFDADCRNTRSITAMSDAVFNETLVLLRWLPASARRRAYAYLLLVGVPRGPGPLGAIKAVVTRRRSCAEAFELCRHATASRFEARREWRATRDQTNETPRVD